MHVSLVCMRDKLEVLQDLSITASHVDMEDKLLSHSTSSYVCDSLTSYLVRKLGVPTPFKIS